MVFRKADLEDQVRPLLQPSMGQEPVTRVRAFGSAVAVVTLMMSGAGTAVAQALEAVIESAQAQIGGEVYDASRVGRFAEVELLSGGRRPRVGPTQGAVHGAPGMSAPDVATPVQGTGATGGCVNCSSPRPSRPSQP
jgi:hypothetical protein